MPSDFFLTNCWRTDTWGASISWLYLPEEWQRRTVTESATSAMWVQRKYINNKNKFLCSAFHKKRLNALYISALVIWPTTFTLIFLCGLWVFDHKKRWLFLEFGCFNFCSAKRNIHRFTFNLKKNEGRKLPLKYYLTIIHVPVLVNTKTFQCLRFFTKLYLLQVVLLLHSHSHFGMGKNKRYQNT